MSKTQATLPGGPVAPPRAHGLPHHFLLTADHYTHPRWLAVEQAEIFRRSWLYVGDVQAMAAGSVRAETVAGQPLVLTCDRNGVLRAFANVCPHRAALLVPQAGTQACRHLVCPYHAWVYDLAGNLVGTPARQQFDPPLDPPALALRPLRLETWCGFAFVCADPAAPPLGTWLGSISTYLGCHRRSSSRSLSRTTTTVHCNWKNYHDNTLCDYHVAIAHRHTLHRVQGPVSQYRHQLETWVNLLYTPTPPGWRQHHASLKDLRGPSGDGFFTYGIYPNLHLLGLPNGLLAWLRIDPQGVDRCQVTLEICADPARTPPLAELLAGFTDFMQEDVALAEAVQRGYASGDYRPGPANGLEARILHQQRLIHGAIAPTETARGA